MTKEELVKERSKSLQGRWSIDYALPLSWVKEVSNLLDIPRQRISRQFVWIYFKEGEGSPFPLTEDADKILASLS